MTPQQNARCEHSAPRRPDRMRPTVSISVFDLFTIGIGPSSSHTVGPMRAARRFVQRLEREGLLDRTTRVRCELFGSLAMTGKGHGTDRAVIVGLEGETPEEVDPHRQVRRVAALRDAHRLALLCRNEVETTEKEDLIFNRKKLLPLHSNGMIFSAFDATGVLLDERTYYSVGGGFVVNQETAGADRLVPDETVLPYHFKSGADLLRLTQETGKPIWELMLANECVWRPAEEVRARLLKIWEAMQSCVDHGCQAHGVLPGSLHVPRRAPRLYAELRARPEDSHKDPLTVLDWVNLYALAV